MKKSILLVASCSVALLAGSAYAADPLKSVWGGGDPSVSAYSGTYVPIVVDNLTKARLAGYEWGGKSAGCVENLQKVTDNPTNVALCQGDLVQSEANKAAFKYTVIRYLDPECLYIATALPGYDNFGNVLGNAFDLVVHTTGEKSGSVGSWKRLAEIYPDLADITLKFHDSDLEAAKAAKEDAAKGQSSIAFFVKRPDPENATFKYISEQKMSYVPVVDFDLENKGYTFPDMPVENAGWSALVGGKAKRITTACANIALVTGDPAALSADAPNAVKKRLAETIARLKEQPKEQWMPKDDAFNKMMNNIADTAPDKLKSLMQKAKDTATSVGENVSKQVNKIAN